MRINGLFWGVKCLCAEVVVAFRSPVQAVRRDGVASLRAECLGAAQRFLRRNRPLVVSGHHHLRMQEALPLLQEMIQLCMRACVLPSQRSSDPAVVFLVEDGRIQRAPSEFSRYIGMPLAAFLEELRSLSQRR